MNKTVSYNGNEYDCEIIDSAGQVRFLFASDCTDCAGRIYIVPGKVRRRRARLCARLFDHLAPIVPNDPDGARQDSRFRGTNVGPLRHCRPEV